MKPILQTAASNGYPFLLLGDYGSVESWKICPVWLATLLSFLLPVCQWNDLIRGVVSTEVWSVE